MFVVKVQTLLNICLTPPETADINVKTLSIFIIGMRDPQKGHVQVSLVQISTHTNKKPRKTDPKMGQHMDLFVY